MAGPPRSRHVGVEIQVQDCQTVRVNVQEAQLPFTDAEGLAAVGEQLLAHVPTEEYPHLTLVSRELLAAGFDYGDEFAFGLAIILDGIARALKGS